MNCQNFPAHWNLVSGLPSLRQPFSWATSSLPRMCTYCEHWQTGETRNCREKTNLPFVKKATTCPSPCGQKNLTFQWATQESPSHTLFGWETTNGEDLPQAHIRRSQGTCKNPRQILKPSLPSLSLSFFQEIPYQSRSLSQVLIPSFFCSCLLVHSANKTSLSATNSCLFISILTWGKNPSFASNKPHAKEMQNFQLNKEESFHISLLINAFTRFSTNRFTQVF